MRLSGVNGPSVLKLALFLLAIGFTAGCVYQRPLTIPGSGLTAPEAAIIHDLASKRSEEINSLKALARVTLTAGKEKDAFRYAVVAARPDLLRLEVLPLNGIYTLGLFVATKGQGTFIDSVEGNRETSNDASALMEKVTGLSVRVDDILPLFLCRIPERLLIGASFFPGKESGSVLMKSADDRFLFEIERTTGLFKLAQELSRGGDSVEKEIKCGAVSQKNGIQVPASLAVSVPRHEARADLVFSSMQINADVQPGLFAVE